MPFIPSLHFIPAADKLKPAFCNDVVNFYYYNNALYSLLEGKNVREIESYASGNFDMTPFKRMFKSLRKKEKFKGPNRILDIERFDLENCGIDWRPVALLPSKLNSAIATIQKRTLDVTATCIDPLAQRKKNKDLEFLRNRKKMVENLQPLYDSMGLGPADPGATQHSSVPFTGLPLDLDIEDESEFKIFADNIYNHASETAIEIALAEFIKVKKIQQLRGLEAADQLNFGVSCNQCLHDKITDLPNYEYVHPGSVRTEKSRLPDHTDNVIRIIDKVVTPMELFNYFPDEIPSIDALEKIVNGDGKNGNVKGYCVCNDGNGSSILQANFGTYKMSLKLVEVRSIDYAMIGTDDDGLNYFVDNEKNAHQKIWAQNTYQFYWLYKTKLFFGIDRLPYSYRTKGQEIYSYFSTNIYRSQKTSGVELCIGENRKAQLADIKLQFELIMAQPDGQLINIKQIRKAVQSLVNEKDSGYTLSEVLEAGAERNKWLYETEDWNGKEINSGPAVTKIPGGMSQSINTYYLVMSQSDQKIDKYIGINNALTGQSENPDTLIGLEKLRLNASINSINYLPEAMLAQYKSLFNIWVFYIQQIIKNGGAAKDALENMIGQRQVELIGRLDTIPIHQYGIELTLGPREEEVTAFKAKLDFKYQQGVLNAFDIWLIERTPNPKEGMFMLGVKEMKFAKQQRQQQQDMLANQQQIAQQQGQNMLQNTQAQTQGKIQQAQAEGQVEAQLLQLSAQLGLTAAQQDALIKLKLQQDRGESQKDKALSTMGAKNQLENQQPFA